MSPGESWLICILFGSLVIVSFGRLAHSLYTQWLIWRHVSVVKLEGLGCVYNEIACLTIKNLTEFIAIYAVREIPKTEIRQLYVGDYTHTIRVKKSCFVHHPQIDPFSWFTKEGYHELPFECEERLFNRIRSFATDDTTTHNSIILNYNLDHSTNTFEVIVEDAHFYFPIDAMYPADVLHPYEEASIFGIDRSEECVICCDAPINTVLANCCHASTCESCTNSFRDGKCPICRSIFKSKIIIPIRPISPRRPTI